MLWFKRLKILIFWRCKTHLDVQQHYILGHHSRQVDFHPSHSRQNIRSNLQPFHASFGTYYVEKNHPASLHFLAKKRRKIDSKFISSHLKASRWTLMVLCVTAMPHWTRTVHFWINLLNLETEFRALRTLIRKRWSDGDTERGLKDVESTSFCSKFHRIIWVFHRRRGHHSSGNKIFCHCLLLLSLFCLVEFFECGRPGGRGDSDGAQNWKTRTAALCHFSHSCLK